MFGECEYGIPYYIFLLIGYSFKSNYLEVGSIYSLVRVDMRSNSKSGEAILIHKKGSKVVGLHCNPIQPELLLSCGNDHFVSFLILLLFICCITIEWFGPSVEVYMGVALFTAIGSCIYF